MMFNDSSSQKLITKIKRNVVSPTFWITHLVIYMLVFIYIRSMDSPQWLEVMWLFGYPVLNSLTYCLLVTYRLSKNNHTKSS